MDPERINHMPTCRTGGYQIGQNYDGLLFKFSTSEDQNAILFALFKHV